jgi:hypothetical protein
VDNTHDGRTSPERKTDIRLPISEVLEVVATLIFRAHLEVPTDFDTLTLLVPAFVIVTSDVVSLDSVPLREFVDEVVQLMIHARGRQQLRFVEPSFPVNPVPGIEYRGDSLALKVIVSKIENIKPGVLVTQVIVRREPEDVGPLVSIASHFALSTLQQEAVA